MNNLIRGDIRRIISKKSLWVAFVAALITNILLVVFYLFTMNYSSINYMQGNIDGVADLGGMIIGIAVFIAVYSDDFRSMIIISIIGRKGFSMRKLLLGALAVIVVGIVFVYLSRQVEGGGNDVKTVVARWLFVGSC